MPRNLSGQVKEAAMTTRFNKLLSRPNLVAFLTSLLALCAMELHAQSRLIGWGGYVFDSDGRVGQFVDISVYGQTMMVVRGDGRAFVNGINHNYCASLPSLPPGVSIRRASLGETCAAVLSDGSIVTWGEAGWQYPPPPIARPAPALPPGMQYVDVSCALHSLAIRSDGHVVAWTSYSPNLSIANAYGQLNVPPLPTGVVATKVLAGNQCSYAVLSNGVIQAWGDNSLGQLNVPPAPPGIGYIDICYGYNHYLALRTDGEIVAWGDNSFGQLNIPPLPSGVVYTHIAALVQVGLAVRSDDTIVVWGTSWNDVGNPPAIPAGLHVEQLATSLTSACAILSDGSLLVWGNNSLMESTVPPTLSTDRYTSVDGGFYQYVATLENGGVIAWGSNAAGKATPPASLGNSQFTLARAGNQHSGALRGDGQLFCWGYNVYGQCDVPTLPAATHYVDFDLGSRHSVAVRSDGEAVAWGLATQGQTSIPPLPAGLHYTACCADGNHTLLLRSDGSVVSFGNDSSSIPSLHAVPPAGPGLHYVAFDTGWDFSAAIRSDGTAVWWGADYSLSSVPTTVPLASLPPLPFGIYYTAVRCGAGHAILYRSDSQFDLCGTVGGSRRVPELPPGSSWVEVAGSSVATSVARVGPTTRYISFAPGCSGSLPSTRLIPSSTPRIGETLEVRLFDLPVDLAIMAMSLQPVAGPVSLASIGMPGCDLEIAIDAVQVLSGNGNQASWFLPIPDQPQLVGLRFLNQALVLDPAAGNSFGAVMSDAAEGVVGFR
jgi:alpha-tubulin suppressor-like RCC1 family protein